MLLLLICSGCRFGEIYQLRLSCIESPKDGETITFHLSEPTKTFTWKRLDQLGLQQLTFRRIPGFTHICPVITLVDYLKKTSPYRKGEDRLFILDQRVPGKISSKYSITRWCCGHLQFAGLGSVTLHSTRWSVSTGCLISGMDLSELTSKIGWLSVSTFLKSYLKPLEDVTQKEPSPPIESNNAEAMINHWKKMPARTFPFSKTHPNVTQGVNNHRLAAKRRRLDNDILAIDQSKNRNKSKTKQRTSQRKHKNSSKIGSDSTHDMLPGISNKTLKKKKKKHKSKTKHKEDKPEQQQLQQKTKKKKRTTKTSSSHRQTFKGTHKGKETCINRCHYTSNN